MKISKRHNSVINVDRVKFFLSAHCLMVVCICTKLHENILDGINVIEGTRFFIRKISKRYNYVKMQMNYDSISLHIVS